MFGLGFFEILIIFLLAIVFINPRDLPAFFRRVGRLYGQIKEARDHLIRSVREMEQEIEKAAPEAQAAEGLRGGDQGGKE